MMNKNTELLNEANKLFLKKLSQKAKKEFKKFQNKNKNINFFTSFTFSPINMSKSWNE